MALGATIFKAQLQVSDLDRGHYGAYALTLARHPSETDLRMMLRILVFAQHAHEDLAFTRGLSTGDEPDLWRYDPAGSIIEWIELGTPDLKRIRKGCSRALQMHLYSYHDRSAHTWWERTGTELERFDTLTVRHLPEEQTHDLTRLAQRTMTLHHTHQDGTIWLGDEHQTVAVTPLTWKGAHS
ncbi:MAG: YaeQ family protein [Gammaproteobacteria bacterium]